MVVSHRIISAAIESASLVLSQRGTALSSASLRITTGLLAIVSTVKPNTLISRYIVPRSRPERVLSITVQFTDYQSVSHRDKLPFMTCEVRPAENSGRLCVIRTGTVSSDKGGIAVEINDAVSSGPAEELGATLVDTLRPEFPRHFPQSSCFSSGSCSAEVPAKPRAAPALPTPPRRPRYSRAVVPGRTRIFEHEQIGILNLFHERQRILKIGVSSPPGNRRSYHR